MSLRPNSSSGPYSSSSFSSPWPSTGKTSSPETRQTHCPSHRSHYLPFSSSPPTTSTIISNGLSPLISWELTHLKVSYVLWSQLAILPSQRSSSHSHCQSRLQPSSIFRSWLIVLTPSIPFSLSSHALSPLAYYFFQLVLRLTTPTSSLLRQTTSLWTAWARLPPAAVSTLTRIVWSILACTTENSLRSTQLPRTTRANRVAQPAASGRRSTQAHNSAG